MFARNYWTVSRVLEGLKRSHPTWKETDIINYHKIKLDFFKSLGIEVLMVEEKNWNNNRNHEINNVLTFIGVN